MHIFAYGSVPKDGGTFTFYRTLRPALREHGWDMRCVTIGAAEHANINPDFVDDGCVSIAPEERHPHRLAQQFLAWCEENNVRIFMPVNSQPMLNAIPHAPKDIKIVTRCADSTDEGYRRATYEHAYISHLCASTPRHTFDLPAYGVPQDKISVIPHGLRLADYLAPSWQTDEHPLRLIFVGRLHEQKGIMTLPAIIRRIENNHVPYHLTVVGSGPHGALLQRKLTNMHLSDHIDFVGTVPREQIPSWLYEADVLLFLSKHEGFGFVLIEGMAAGCVPVSSRLDGVTDFIIEDDVTGMLCPIGNADCFAQAITRLHENRQRLQQMGTTAAQAARQRFSQERMAVDYAKVLNDVLASPIVTPEPRSWDDFRQAALAPRKWHDFIPRSTKHQLRRLWYYLRS